METLRTFTPAQIASAVVEARTLQNQDCERIAQQQLAKDLEERILQENPDEISQDVARQLIRELGEKERIPQEYIERILLARYPTTQDHEEFIATTGAHVSEEILTQRMVERLNTIAHDLGKRLTTHLQAYDASAHYRYDMMPAKGDNPHNDILGIYAHITVERHTTTSESRPGGWWYRFSTGKRDVVTTKKTVEEICDASIQGSDTTKAHPFSLYSRSKTRFTIIMNGRDPMFSSCDDAIEAFKDANHDVTQCIPTLHYEIKNE